MKTANYASADEAISIAEALGLEVIEADDRTLLLDIDSKTALDQHERCACILAGVEGIHERDRWPSKSGQGWHIRIALDRPRPIEERLRLQSLLASDPVREALHWMELREKGSARILAFRPAPAGVQR